MLSRGAVLSSQQAKALFALACRSSASASAVQPAGAADNKLTNRPIRQEPGKVRMGFIPEEWFQFFYNKTGVTGPYTFAFTLGTYLISKEIYVMEHEYYSGLSLAILWYVGITRLGPKLAQSLDKEIDEYEAQWNEGRRLQTKTLQDQIADEEQAQWSVEGQNILIQAKRENVALQLEAAYRERLMLAYSEVKNRLDYQVEKQNAERRIAQKNLVDWVVRKVRESITPDQEKANIEKCIADLDGLAKVA